MMVKKMMFDVVFGVCLGFINYYILSNLNKNGTDKDDKTFSLILFSMWNMLLLKFMNGYIQNRYVSVFISLIITIILSFIVFKRLFDILYILLNIFRDRAGLGESNNRSVRSLIFDNNKVLFVYLYGLENDKLLSYGCMGWQNESKNKDYDFEIVPTDLIKPVTFDEAVLLAQKHDDASIYINIDKKIKMVVIPESE